MQADLFVKPLGFFFKDLGFFFCFFFLFGVREGGGGDILMVLNRLVHLLYSCG